MSLCRWCQQAPPRPGGIYCGRKCRQSAFRLRRREQLDATSGPGAPPGLVFAYADPPYPGLSSKYYRREPTFAGEVDHRELVASLAAAGYAGWALSTSSKALRDVLPLCPPGARVCAWVKPIGVPPATYGLHSTWEALIVVGGRRCRPGVRDWLGAQPARGGGTLPGRKPIAFCAFLFRALGMVPGDRLVDLFPGTGIVTRAWGELSSRTSATPVGLEASATPVGLEASATPVGLEASATPSLLQQERQAPGRSLAAGGDAVARAVADAGVGDACKPPISEGRNA